MWHEILHAFIDSIKVFPILFLVYVIIELIETHTSKTISHSKFLKSKYAPVFGAGVGLIPQCGFSVIATDLYTKKKITISTLLAIYIATSDEAVPILLSYPDKYLDLIIILAIKFVLAVLVGYVSMLVLNFVSVPKTRTAGIMKECNSNHTKISANSAQVNHSYFVGEISIEDDHKGCCGHSIENERKHNKFLNYVYHPIMHSLKIFAFILLVNIVFGLIIYFVGEQTITQSLIATKWLQPFIAGLIGLIPNCASSVIITRLFAMGGLTLGACVSGLVANAGIGLALLVKQNENKKHTLYIILTLYAISAISGLIITLI